VALWRGDAAGGRQAGGQRQAAVSVTGGHGGGCSEKYGGQEY